MVERHGRKVVGLSVMLLMLAVLASCDSGGDDDADDRLEVGTVTTGSGGTATLEVGGYQIAVTTQTTAGTAAQQVGVRAVVSDRYLFVVTDDPQGRYYPGIHIGRLPSGSPPSTPLSVPIQLQEVGLLMLPLASSPEFIDALFNEGGFGRECAEGDLETILAAIEAAGTAGLGLIFHLTQAAAGDLGYDQTRTAAVSDLLLEEDLALVTALMGTVFGIFARDFQTVCWGTGPTGGAATPFYWTDIDPNRDFAMRITLTWGENPDDLDSHLFTPEIMGTRHQVYWLNEGSLVNPPYAELDVDDVSSFGPENVTIDRLMPGTYRYAVHHFAGTGTVTTSGAQVRLFTPAGLQHTLNVPTTDSQDNWWWHVFNIDGATGAVQVVNSVSENPPVEAAAKSASISKDAS